MKSHRNRFRRRARARRGRSLRGTTFNFIRCSSLEGLELRAMLSGNSPLDDSALFASADDDVHATPIDALSVANMCASALGQQDAGQVPSAAPLAATSASGDDDDGGPTVEPLVEGAVVQTLLRLEDLNGNEITSVKVGEDFNLLIFVDDVRTSSETAGIFGVFSAYVRATYDSDLVSLDDPDSLVVDDFFGNPPIDVRTDTSTPGEIRAGGAATSGAAPGTDPQLLWTATLHAVGAGTLSFDTFFEEFLDDAFEAQWLMYAEGDVLTADNFSGNSLELTVIGPDISIGDVTELETNGSQNFVFTVSLAEASTQPVTVAFATNPGTASDTGAGQDFVAQSGTLTFNAGVTQQTITINVVGDADEESDETFTVVLSNPVGGEIADGTGLGTIQDDDSVPTLTITAPQNTNEGTSATNSQFVFTATLSEASGQEVFVTFSTEDGTAIAGDDYVATTGTLTFQPGTTSQTITVSVIADAEVESNETFTINLSNPQNVALAQTSITGTITNDDDVPELSIANPALQNEGNQGGTPFVFTVTLSSPSTEVVTVAFATTDGIASVADNDYTATSGTLTFQPGTTTQTITVLVTGDTRREASETFSVVLSSPVGATIANGVGNAVIVDDDLGPQVSISDVSQSEGDSGTTLFVFTVTLSSESTETARVSFATQDGTATVGGNDYIATSGTLTFAPGTTTQFVTVSVIGDSILEPNETFSVVLSNPVNVLLGDATGLGTILSESTDEVSNLPSSISGQVFVDSNGNGSHNGNEKPLAGIEVFLTGASSAQTTTGPGGSYSFNGLAPGTYTVTFAPLGEFKVGEVHIGSQGGATTSNSFTFTIEAPGGITGTNNHFTTSGLQTQFISQRLFLASALGGTTTSPVDVTLAIGSVTDPIVASSAFNTTISGTATAGATISVTASDGNNTTAAQITTTDNSGNWSIGGINVSALADGTITYTVTATGTGGSTKQDTITATKDTAAPAVDIGSVTDPVNSSNQTDTSINGTGEVGASITVVVSDGTHSTNGQTTVDANGNWSVGGLNVSGLNDGMITYTVTATDEVGNAGTDSMQVLKDTVSPTVDVTMIIPDPINDENQQNVTIEGTGQAGASISLTVSDDNGSTNAFTTTVGQDGTWQITGVDVSQLADGTLTVTVVATDSANNTTTITESVGKDTVTEVIVDGVTDPITSANVETVITTGTGEAGATVSVVASDTADSNVSGMATVDENGDWSVTLDLTALVDGEITFTTTATDLAGNTDEKTDTADKDTVTEVMITDLPDSIGIGDDESVTVSGTGEAGATVEVVVTDADDNATDAFMTTVDGDGNWTLNADLSGLNDGTLTFTATATDLADNTAQHVDTAEKATLTVAPIAEPINAANQDAVTISGTGEVGATVSIVASDGDTTTDAVETTILEDGTWSTTVDVSGLIDGDITFTVTATDVDDNMAQKMIVADKDTVTEVIVDSVTDPISPETADNTSISGTGEVGATISVMASDGVDSTIAFMVTVDGAGNWSIDGIDVSGLADGIITYTATATDDAGNVNMDEITAEKISVAPLALMDGEDDDELAAVVSALTAADDDPDAIDEVLALEEDWTGDFD